MAPSPSSPASPPPRARKAALKPRSLKRLLLRRLFVVVPAFLLMWLAVRSGALDTVYDTMTFKKLSWFDNTALVEHLRIRIVHDRLTNLPRRCLVFIVNGGPENNTPAIEVLGREGNGCPGSKPDAKTLFHIQVNRAGRTILTDAGSAGQFHPLP